MENPRWKLKGQLYRRRKAAKKFNEFVVMATDGLGIEQLSRAAKEPQIYECHQDDFYVSGSNVALAGLQENLGARLKLKPAEPLGPGSRSAVTSVRRERGLTRTPFTLDHVRLTSRTFWTSWVSATTSANRCRPRLCEEARRPYHRCAGILRHLLKYRPDIAFAVHEVSKTLASSSQRRHNKLIFRSELFQEIVEAIEA